MCIYIYIYIYICMRVYTFLYCICMSMYIYFVCIYTYACVYIYEEYTISFQTFFVWALLLIVHTWNSSPLRSNLLRLQSTYCAVPTTSRRPHWSPLVWACQWPSSHPLSSLGITKSHREQGLDYREAEELSWCPSCSNSLWQGWSCGLVYCPGGNATEPIWRVLFRWNLILNSLKTST